MQRLSNWVKKIVGNIGKREWRVHRLNVAGKKKASEMASHFKINSQINGPDGNL